MCGICSMAGPDAEYVMVQNMLMWPGPSRTRRRGIYEDTGVVLGHRRLSIIDLVTGDQPMSNEDGTVWVVYNGEIYNFRDLRHDLEQRGHRFHSQSDTEVLVHGYEEYGLSFLTRLDGIFAFGLWDRRHRRLLLVLTTLA